MKHPDLISACQIWQYSGWFFLSFNFVFPPLKYSTAYNQCHSHVSQGRKRRRHEIQTAADFEEAAWWQLFFSFLFFFLHRRWLPQHDGKFLAVTSLMELISLSIVSTILSFNCPGGTQNLPQREKKKCSHYKQQHTHNLSLTHTNTHICSLAQVTTDMSLTQPNTILHKSFSLKSTLVFSIWFSFTVSIIKRSIFDHLKTEQHELWHPRNPAKP